MDAPRRARNPVAWLVVGIPVLTVIAGLWTLKLAAGPSATDAHPDQVRRMAQVQEASIEADANAAKLGLRARVRVLADQAVVSVEPGSGPLAPELQLRHPIESTLDRVLPLTPGPQGWRSGESMAAAHGWQVQLVAGDGSWRLVGRYQPGDTEVVLAPSLAAP